MPKSGVSLSVLRRITRLLAPGPEIMTLLSIERVPLVSVIVLTPAKSIVSPVPALTRASRSEPGPSSAGLVTVAARPGAQSKSAVRAKRVILEPGLFPKDKCVLYIGRAASSTGNAILAKGARSTNLLTGRTQGGIRESVQVAASGR